MYASPYRVCGGNRRLSLTTLRLHHSVLRTISYPLTYILLDLGTLEAHKVSDYVIKKYIKRSVVKL